MELKDFCDWLKSIRKGRILELGTCRSDTFKEKSFDAIIACSAFEHIQRPWIAAREIAKLLKPTGKAFIQTHQSFPIHGYPCYYWRFIVDALKTIFGDTGLKGKGYYEFPCQIFSK